jgi:hypothetical protein
MYARPLPVAFSLAVDCQGEVNWAAAAAAAV